MISVAEALAHLFELVAPVGTETVSLRRASGRVLAAPVVAARNQPPFAASIMDGYAVPDEDVRPGATYRIVGEAAAGSRLDGGLGTGQCARIFTGAPLPEGARRVVIQEDVDRRGDRITVKSDVESPLFIREIGADFKPGMTVASPRRLGPQDVALIAAMNIPDVEVYCRPTVALLTTGDELVMPGETPGDDQIIASNALGLAALVEAAGGSPRLLPIARDNMESLLEAFRLAEGADLVVTIGGASVGDRDLVGKAAAALGMEPRFYKIAMRPGKPMMAGKLGDATMIGLPGNPVSSMVCGHIFLRPVLAAMQGLPPAPLPRRRLPLAAEVPANGAREHYMRATAADGSVRAAERQDSALLSVLADSNALIVRPPNDPARAAGHMVQVIDLAIH